ncbi:MAG TPA: hypothetical protein VE956_04165 [Nodularia sp. (in: cyanobacteria)]|nr:hypothetical protein [Nodularia sp. (in: cyanobacteria)]
MRLRLLAALTAERVYERRQEIETFYIYLILSLAFCTLLTCNLL